MLAAVLLESRTLAMSRVSCLTTVDGRLLYANCGTGSVPLEEDCEAASYLFLQQRGEGECLERSYSRVGIRHDVADDLGRQ